MQVASLRQYSMCSGLPCASCKLARSRLGVLQRSTTTMCPALPAAPAILATASAFSCRPKYLPARPYALMLKQTAAARLPPHPTPLLPMQSDELADSLIASLESSNTIARQQLETSNEHFQSLAQAMQRGQAIREEIADTLKVLVNHITARLGQPSVEPERPTPRQQH